MSLTFALAALIQTILAVRLEENEIQEIKGLVEHPEDPEQPFSTSVYRVYRRSGEPDRFYHADTHQQVISTGYWAELCNELSQCIAEGNCETEVPYHAILYNS